MEEEVNEGSDNMRKDKRGVEIREGMTGGKKMARAENGKNKTKQREDERRKKNNTI